MKKILYIIAAGAMLLAGCSKESDTPATDSSAVKFSTEIATRASGTTWDNGDAIGVFMKSAGQPLLGSNLADNVKYTTNGADFSTTTPIYYPLSGNVDFVAYYPYQATFATPYIYKVDVSSQTTPAAIDLLYSNNAVNKAKSTTAVALAFDHKLSRMVLNIKAGEGMTAGELTGVTVKITSMPTTADFSLADGTFGTPSTVSAITPIVATTTSGFVATYTAIVVPQAVSAWSGRKMVFTVGADVYEYPIPDTDDFASGKNHPYTITVSKTGVSVTRGTITDWTTTIPEDIVAEQIPIPQTVKIPAGTFLMGSPDSEPNRRSDEIQHSVTLTKDFYMSKYAITSSQYAAFLNANNVGMDGKLDVAGYGEKVLFDENIWGWSPKWNTATNQWESARTSPMIYVSWFGAVAYCNWLSEQTGGTWRLPTEAEWEYACRAGTTTAYSFGADNISDYAVYRSNNGGGSAPSAVGTKLPNPLGLYDMHGNAFEWCSDWYGSYGDTAATDPTGPTTGYNRVLRGGSWNDDAQNCRSAYRSYDHPATRYSNVGFRVVFVP